MNNGLILFFFLLLNQTKRKNILETSKDNKSIKLKSPMNKTITLNIPYTNQKIKIMKKIGPYFPEEFIPVLNKALIITEKIIKFYEAIDFIQIKEVKYIENPIPIENNKERLSRIINTIQREFPTEEINNIGMIMEIILNTDKYKKMFTVLNSIMSNPDNFNDPTKIYSLIEPFMQNKDEKEKLKNMVKMLEIMNTLDTPKKPKNEEKPKES
jgi:hypothetical protein